jgi:hypothetical protein
MRTIPLTPETLDAIAEEHDVLGGLYERILTALQTGPGDKGLVPKLLDELAKKLAEHFVHEENGGYYSHVVEVAPSQAGTVEELKRQHLQLSRTVARIAEGAHKAEGALHSWEVVRKDFDAFLRRCVEHEANEERVIRETYLLDVVAIERKPTRAPCWSQSLVD